MPNTRSTTRKTDNVLEKVQNIPKAVRLPFELGLEFLIELLFWFFGPLVGIFKFSLYVFLLNATAMYALKAQEIFNGDRGQL